MANRERWKGLRPLTPDIGCKLEKIIPLIRREGVLLAYLFGSLCKGFLANDVDLALLADKIPIYQLRGMITGILETERVDLVDLKIASPLLCFEVISTGYSLYVADEVLHERFEMSVLRTYRDTAPLRLRQKEYLKRRIVQWSSEKKSLLKD